MTDILTYEAWRAQRRIERYYERLAPVIAANHELHNARVRRGLSPPMPSASVVVPPHNTPHAGAGGTYSCPDHEPPKRTHWAESWWFIGLIWAGLVATAIFGGAK